MIYRFLRLSDLGSVDAVVVVDLSDDNAALDRARSFVIGGAVEVWRQNRPFATLKPGFRDRATA